MPETATAEPEQDTTPETPMTDDKPKDDSEDQPTKKRAARKKAASAKKQDLVPTLSEEDKQRELIYQRLLAPFLPQDIKSRPGAVKQGKAIPLLYVDSRTVVKRLNQVIGPGRWSAPGIDISFGHETLKKKKWGDLKEGEDPFEITEGLLVGMVSYIEIDHPFFKTKVSNVGEQGPKDLDNKLTSAHAQAFKRAASMLGVGAYLYEIKMAPHSYDRKTRSLVNFSLPKDEIVHKALEDAGFKLKCEATGEDVNWKWAAWSVSNLGQVLCEEEVKRRRSG